MTRRKKITIQDIAQELNVSFATVSNALNYRKGVSEEVRELVFAQAQKMGYPIKPKPVDMSQEQSYGASLQIGSVQANLGAYQPNVGYPANGAYQTNMGNPVQASNMSPNMHSYSALVNPLASNTTIGQPTSAIDNTTYVPNTLLPNTPLFAAGNLGAPQGGVSNGNVSILQGDLNLQSNPAYPAFASSATSRLASASDAASSLGTNSMSNASNVAANLPQSAQTSSQNSILENMRLAVFLDSFFVQEIPSFYLEIFKNIIQACSSLHCCANLIPVVHNSVEVNLSSLNNLSCQGGIIIGQLPQAVIDNLKGRLNVPFIVLDHFDDGDESLHFIQLDSFISMHSLVNEIIKRGYQDICFVGSIHQTKSILDRFLGYAKAMEEHGLKQHIRYIEDRDFSKGPWLTFELPDKLPQIFVCNCDKTAALVIHTLQQKGLKVPQDVGVAGFDNFGAQITSKLRLFTFEHSPQVLANLALQTIASQLQHQPLEHSLFIEGRIIQGNSILESFTPQAHEAHQTKEEHLTSNVVSSQEVESVDSCQHELNLEIKAAEIAEEKMQGFKANPDTIQAMDATNPSDAENLTTASRLARPSSDLSGLPSTLDLSGSPSTSDLSGSSSASIRELVEQSLQSEKTTVSSGNVTLQDIAKVLKTSTVTVSNALSGKAGVSDEMRTKIVATAQKLGYVPRGMKKRVQLQHNGQLGLLGNQYVDCLAPVIQANAYALNKPLQHLICIVVAKRYLTVGGSFYWELYQHLISSTLQYGFTTTIAIMEDQQIESNAIPDAITLNRPDGIVAMGPFPKLYLQHLSQQGLPCMQLDASENELQLPAVMTNNYINSYKITHHLILKGHSKIGFVGTRSNFDNITDRFYGFKRAMLESQLPINEDWILDDRDEQSGRMFDAIALPERLPTAFVCNCDAAAYLLYNTLRTQGIKVPQDVSLVGYDNYLYGVDFANDLTTINVDLKKMAEHTVKNMLCLIQHQPLSCRVERLECRIIQRNSVQPLIDSINS